MRPRSGVGRALVVGGGVAGPTLAMFLRRLGVEVTVLEARGSAAGDEGAFLGLAPNGLRVLRALGLADAIAARGVECRGIRFENARGRCIGVLDHADHAERFGARLLMIRRGALHAALVEAAASRGARVRFGARLVGVEADTGEVTARLERGEALRGDALLGSGARRGCPRTG